MVSPPVAGNALTVDRTTEPDTFFHIDDFQGLSPIYQPIQGNFYRLQTPDFIQTRKMLLLK